MLRLVQLVALCVVIVSTSQLGSCNQKIEKIEGFGDSFDEPVLFVMDKLERYSLGLVENSGVTIEDLRQAYLQYKNWSPRGRIWVMKKMPLMRLFVDFALIPMDNYELQIVDDGDEEFNKLYIVRLETNYKRFRPAYLGRALDAGDYYRSPKMNKVQTALLKKANYEPLTKQMIEDAKLEFNSHLGLMHDIETTDDIYSNLRTLTFLFNNFNRGDLLAVVEAVFPNGHILDEVDGEEKLIELYRQSLTKRNYIFDKLKDGSPILSWYGPIDIYP